MASPALFQQILGDKFEQLQDPVKNHFSLAPNDPARVILTGQMDVIWHPVWLTIPMWVSSWGGILFPETGRNIPTRVIIEAQEGLRQQWHRTFKFDRRQRTFSDAMVYDPVKKRTLNFFGSYDQFAMVFHFVITPQGGLEVIGGQQYLNLGRSRIPSPRVLTPAVITREWPINNDTIAVDFTMYHPLFGKLYQYAGRFTVSKEINDN